MFGKPLRWTAAWTAVLLVWVAAAAGLTAVRVDMGHLMQLTPRERTAIDQVRNGTLQGDVTYGEALAGVLTRYGALLDTQPTWYVQDIPWERRLYVTWELGSDIRLGWTVTYDGRVSPGAETALFLKDNLKAGTPTPLPTQLPGF